MSDINQAIRLAPQNGWLYWMRSKTWKALGEPEKSQADLAQALELSPEIAATEGAQGDGAQE